MEGSSSSATRVHKTMLSGRGSRSRPMRKERELSSGTVVVGGSISLEHFRCRRDHDDLQEWRREISCEVFPRAESYRKCPPGGKLRRGRHRFRQRRRCGRAGADERCQAAGDALMRSRRGLAAGAAISRCGRASARAR